MRTSCAIILSLFIIACNPADRPSNKAEAAQAFLDRYTREYVKLNTASEEATWKANIEIKPGDPVNDLASQIALEEAALFLGKKLKTDSANYYLSHSNELNDLQILQLKRILYKAANNPEVAGDIVRQRIKKETEANSKLFGFTFTLDGKPVSVNAIDGILSKETDIQKRQQAWEASKEVGKELKNDLVDLRDLRNKTVQAMGFKDFFAYQVADYGMSTDEMITLNEGFVRTIWPLYREIHTYARHELANRYHQPVPEYLPAHWLANRWGQNWADMIELKGADLNEPLKNLTAKEIVSRGEKFYISLGFNPLPETFWTKSSLYPFPADSAVKKNNHASAWHINLQDDYRSLMSVEPNDHWWTTSHHELGHIFYYQAYSRPDVPMLLRGGANRGYHEAIGSLIGLASTQLPYLKSQGLFLPTVLEDTLQKLLKEALQYVVALPWQSGVMTQFEKNLYADNLDANQLNKHWWELVKKYQGIVPPTERGEEYADAATKTHIIDDAAQYYDYAISSCLLMQMHGHIANKILRQDPHATNYYGSKETGEFLRSIMALGATRDWRKVLKESTGSDISADALMDYYKPLMAWLQQQNKGRKHSLPEQPM